MVLVFQTHHPGWPGSGGVSVPTDDLELGRLVCRRRADELPRVYAQAQAYAEELHRLYLERQAPEAELPAKVEELERSTSSYWRTPPISVAELAAEGDLPPDPRSARPGRGPARRHDRRHCVRVADYSRVLGERILGSRPQEFQVLEYGALLHDIGKIAVPDAILRKDGPLTEDEWRSCASTRISATRSCTDRFLVDSLPIVLHHHERFDGKGYPHELPERISRSAPGSSRPPTPSTR